jgi:hypothetical protein
MLLPIGGHGFAWGLKEKTSSFGAILKAPHFSVHAFGHWNIKEENRH